MSGDLKMEPASGCLIGVDTGGTFTDIVFLDPVSSTLQVSKTASTPEDASLGFRNGIAQVLAETGVSGSRVGRVLHATTVATNLILERKGPATAVIVTQGYRFMLEIGRHNIAKKANMYTWVKPPRPVPVPLVWEVPGRLDHHGNEVEPLDEAAVRAVARELAAKGIRTVAVTLLHSYCNATHEQRVADILRAEIPEVMVSLSSEVLPVFREYERCVTTILNAYVSPVVSTYVRRLEERLAECAIKAPLLLMKSSGGMTSTRSAQKKPVETALSGPAAGAVGAAFIGASAGFRDLITIDIGGTSADIGLIQDGVPRLTSNGMVGDWKMAIPIVDILTIGAGGGSIARATADGGLLVGPQSAGAVPGPVCYRRGGVEPTVTDAHLVLGHLLPELLGGAFQLDLPAARNAIENRIARPLGLSVEQAARGILDVLDHNMVGTMRVVSVERGFDPRDFVLVPFGGAGPLHGCTLSRLIGSRTILIPPAPGVLSALGLLVSNLRAEFSRTCLQRAGHYDLKALSDTFAELSRQAAAWLDNENVAAKDRKLLLQASLRYKDQGFELDIPWAGGEVTPAALDATVKAFHDMHERLYTFALRDTPVEIVTLRVDAIGMLPAVKLPQITARGSADQARVGEQTLALPEGPVMAPVYHRERLGVDAEVAGPAVLTQLDATTLLLPGQTAIVDKYGSLIVREVAG